jgi:hypothetical protein
VDLELDAWLARAKRIINSGSFEGCGPRLRLATKPCATGSPPLTKTIGIVVLAFDETYFLQANAECSHQMGRVRERRAAQEPSAEICHFRSGLHSGYSPATRPGASPPTSRSSWSCCAGQRLTNDSKGKRKTASRRSLPNPIRCFDQAAMRAAASMSVHKGLIYEIADERLVMRSLKKRYLHQQDRYQLFLRINPKSRTPGALPIEHPR